MNKFEEKTREVHGGFYLTLVSMMQSLALGYLLQTVGAEFMERGMISLNMLFQVLVVLLCIVIVWHEYAIGTIIFRWRLDVFDSVIPFLFGITEYFSIASIAMPETNKYFGEIRYSMWLWSLVAFTVVAMIAYINQSKKAEVERGMKRLLAAPKRNLRHALSTTLIFLVVAVFFYFYPLENKYKWILSAVIFAVLLFEMFRINTVYAGMSNTKVKQD